MGWRQEASWVASTFWHRLKEHLVPLCGPTTEGQRMFSLAATWWPKFSGPSGPTRTEIEKNSPFFLFWSQHGNHCVLCSRGHWGCLEKRWKLSSKDGIHDLQQGFPGTVTMPCRWLWQTSFVLEWLWPPFPQMLTTHLQTALVLNRHFAIRHCFSSRNMSTHRTKAHPTWTLGSFLLFSKNEDPTCSGLMSQLLSGLWASSPISRPRCRQHSPHPPTPHPPPPHPLPRKQQSSQSLW